MVQSPPVLKTVPGVGAFGEGMANADKMGNEATRIVLNMMVCDAGSCFGVGRRERKKNSKRTLSPLGELEGHEKTHQTTLTLRKKRATFGGCGQRKEWQMVDEEMRQRAMRRRFVWRASVTVWESNGAGSASGRR